MANDSFKNSIFGQLNFGSPKPKKPAIYDAYGTNINDFGNEMGFSPNYATDLRNSLAQLYQKQLDDATAQAGETAIASGDFNPNLSNYYATKGAREAQQLGGIKAIEAGRQDEFNRFGALNTMANTKLAQDQLAFSQKAYADQQPTWLDDAMGVVSQISNFVPFLKKGGKVPKVMHEWKAGTLHSGSPSGPIVHNQNQAIAIALSEERKRKAGKYAGGGEVEKWIPKNLKKGALHSDLGVPQGQKIPLSELESASHGSGKTASRAKFALAMRSIHKADGGDIPSSDQIQYANNGLITSDLVNSPPASTGDNTLIMAQPNEVIQSNPAGDLAGRENLKLINEGGQMANSLLGGTADKFGNMMASKAMPMQKQGLLGMGGPQVGMADKFKNIVSGLFQTGGVTDGNPPTSNADKISAIDNQIAMIKGQMKNYDQNSDQYRGMIDQINQLMDDRKILVLQDQEQLQQIQSQTPGGQTIQNPTDTTGQVPKTRKITIEEKPSGF